MASVFEQLQEKYRGLSVDYSSEERRTIITYQGTKELCTQAMESIFKINTTDKTYGNIENVRMTNGGNGPIWDLEVTYVIELDANGNKLSKGSTFNAKNAELSMSMLSLPLEKLSKYRKKWNNNLYSTVPKDNVPSFWDTADYDYDGIAGTNYEYPGDGTTSPTSRTFYAWGASLSDLPALPTGFIWHKVKAMTKPGVECFNYPVYTLTEKSKHSSKRQAGWAVAKRAGRVSPPSQGDFGITANFGGDWLCEGGTVSYDGKYWIATCTYTHSPSMNGWDIDLYMDEIH